MILAQNNPILLYEMDNKLDNSSITVTLKVEMFDLSSEVQNNRIYQNETYQKLMLQ